VRNWRGFEWMDANHDLQRLGGRPEYFEISGFLTDASNTAAGCRVRELPDARANGRDDIDVLCPTGQATTEDNWQRPAGRAASSPSRHLNTSQSVTFIAAPVNAN
jgi:hypothetical protein